MAVCCLGDRIIGDVFMLHSTKQLAINCRHVHFVALCQYFYIQSSTRLIE